MLLTLAAAVAASAAPAVTPGPGGTAVRNDLQRRAQPTRVAHDDRDGALAQFSGPACEVPDHDSGNHFGWVKHNANGLIGGSYGEVFFASGAGTRAVTTTTGTNTATGGNGSTETPGAPATAGSGNGGSSATTGASAASTTGAAASAAATTGATGTSVTAVVTSADPAADPPAGPSPNANPRAFAATSLALNVGEAAVNPEPATLILLGTGFGAVLLRERRRRSKK